ncbi:MAG: amidohydrolase family protein [Bacteroidetes bacterium]|nr:amidohydrolase family protein [Bacteroidota bacterium]
MNLEIKDVDKRFYKEHLEDFLPENIIDIHTHVYIKEITGTAAVQDKRLVSWTSLVAEDNPIEDLLECYRLMIPGKKVVPCLFPWVEPLQKIDELNEYTRASASSRNLPVLFLDHPDYRMEELEQKLVDGAYNGIKVYLSLAPSYIPGNEVRIFDFLPHGHLAVLDKLGLMVMLHIPRSGRLKDPVNLAQIVEIEQKYPNVKVVLAHVGRAYCPEDVGDAFEILGKTENLAFDCSANTNPEVFRQALESLGPRRMTFGSDLPITRMRMRRICENGTYINLIPKGLYGNVSGDKNMRELEGEEAARLSFFLYEEIKAMKEAVNELGLNKSDVEDIFYNNAKRIFESTGFSMADAGRIIG